MKILLALHSIALGSDGMRPELVELLGRQSAVETDPKIIMLGRYDVDRPSQAGPFPGCQSCGLVAEGTSRRGRSMIKLHQVKSRRAKRRSMAPTAEMGRFGR